MHRAPRNVGDAMMLPPSDLNFHDSCVFMAKQGISVVMKCPRTNTPRYGFRDRPPKTPDEISACIRQDGCRGAGLCIPRNYGVLDFDYDADDQYRAFRDRYGLDDGHIARSPNNNLQVWYKLPDGVEIINGTNKGGPVGVTQLDILNHKSLATLPTSWRPANPKRGKRQGYYTWLKRPRKDVYLPDRVTRLLPPKKYDNVHKPYVRPDRDLTEAERNQALEYLYDAATFLAGLTDDRNNELNRRSFMTGQLVGGGLLKATDVRREFENASKANGHWRDKGPTQTINTIESGLRKGIQKPIYEVPRARH